MVFRASEVRFVDEQETLINQADAMDSQGYYSQSQQYVPISDIGASRSEFDGGADFDNM